MKNLRHFCQICSPIQIIFLPKNMFEDSNQSNWSLVHFETHTHI